MWLFTLMILNNQYISISSNTFLNCYFKRLNEIYLMSNIKSNLYVASSNIMWGTVQAAKIDLVQVIPSYFKSK